METTTAQVNTQDSNIPSETKKGIRKVETRRWEKAIAPNHHHHTVEPPVAWEVSTKLAG